MCHMRKPEAAGSCCPERGNLLRQNGGVLVARGRVVVAELLAQRLLELARLLELLDDVGATHELALHEHLRDRRPTRDRGQLLPDRGVGQHVDGGHRRTCTPERLQRAIGVPAHRERGRPLHEDRHVRSFDDFLDLLRIAHSVPLVLIRSSWIVPSASGVDSASYTRRCCSTSDSPLSEGDAPITWKWAPPPVLSRTSSSVASGNARSSRSRSGCVLTRRS